MQVLLSTGLTFQVMTNEAAGDLALRLGYEGIEWMMQPARPRRAAMTYPGNALVCTHAAVKVIHAPFSLQGGRRYWDSIANAICNARWNDHRVPTVNIHPHSCHMVFGGARAQSRAGRKIKQLEAEHSLTLAVEVLPRPRGSWRKMKRWLNWLQQPFFSPEAWVDYIRAQELHATIDTTHLATWGVKEPARYIQELKDQLRHVHLSDYISVTDTEHVIPGDGDLDLKEFLQELKRLAPEVTVTIELQPASSQAKARADAGRSLDFVRTALA